jgi:hypothetical protein
MDAYPGQTSSSLKDGRRGQEMVSSCSKEAEVYVSGCQQQAAPECPVLSMTCWERDEWLEVECTIHFHLLCKQVHACVCLHTCVNPTGTSYSHDHWPCVIILRTQRIAGLTYLCSAHYSCLVVSREKLGEWKVMETSFSTSFVINS